MDKPQLSKPGPALFGPKEAAEALNDQGFLFQQLIRERVQNRLPGEANPQSGWGLEASEYPVMAADGTQTRIDLVLGHARQPGIKICLECKRPNPRYKSWLFFDRDQSILNVREDALFFETARATSEGTRAIQRDINPVWPAAPCPAFNYYLEGARKRGAESASSPAERSRSGRGSAK